MKIFLPAQRKWSRKLTLGSFELPQITIIYTTLCIHTPGTILCSVVKFENNNNHWNHFGISVSYKWVTQKIAKIVQLYQKYSYTPTVYYNFQYNSQSKSSIFRRDRSM